MNPKPFASSNHFTVPRSIASISYRSNPNMRRLLAALIVLAITSTLFGAGFDFRTTGTQTVQIFNFRPTDGPAPAVSDLGWGKIMLAGSITGGGFSPGNFYVSQNHGQWVLLSSFVNSG